MHPFISFVFLAPFKSLNNKVDGQLIHHFSLYMLLIFYISFAIPVSLSEATEHPKLSVIYELSLTLKRKVPPLHGNCSKHSVKTQNSE